MTMLIGVPAAHAAAINRIVFSGAVVEPTCSMEGASNGAALGSSNESVRNHLSCGRTSTNPGRSFSRTVTDLAVADLSHDRLLDYFASYAGAAGSSEATAKVVVYIYD
ncbi:hypothetical protein ACPPVV_17440 [Rhodanobacter sp. Col0626]|uniref:hypothetical protein n=1 Tax=Rhodanobacter sp. Col0626 TaxID=3415679 RepID=UPI003CF7719C